MISERLFVRRYLSFWHDALPFGEAFVRGLNSRLNMHVAQDSSWGGETGRRSAVAQLAAFMFERGDPELDLDLAFEQTAAQLGVNLEDKLDEFERSELQRAYDYLTRYVSRSRLLIRPQFAGCGIVSLCEGDYLVGDTLFEMKYGWHGFRAVDIRQVLTYCALNFLSGQHKIASFGLINPRIGRHFTLGLDQAAEQLSGSSAAALLRKIAQFMQEGAPSGL